VVSPDVQPSDGELLTQVRAGRIEAYGLLYERHIGAARMFARKLAGTDVVADDVVAEAFTKVLAAIQNGGGPYVTFRPYLFVAIRSVANRIAVLSGRSLPTAGDSFDLPSEEDGLLEATDRALVMQAFVSLPERWRAVLWHLEAEGLSPGEVGAMVGLSPNAVSALAYRAREALRHAYLKVHINTSTTLPLACRSVADLLPGYLRGSLTPRQHDSVEAHVADCARCTAVLGELGEVETAFRSLLTPLVALAGGATVLGRAGRPRTGRPRGGWPRSPGRGILAVFGVLALAALLVGVVVIAIGGFDDTAGREASDISAASSPRASLPSPTTRPRSILPSAQGPSPTSVPVVADDGPEPEAPASRAPADDPAPSASVPGTSGGPEGLPPVGADPADPAGVPTDVPTTSLPADPGPEPEPDPGVAVQAQSLGDVVVGRPSAVVVTADLPEPGWVDLTLWSDAGDLVVTGQEPGVMCDGPSPLRCLVPARADGRAQLIVLVPALSGPAAFTASAVPEGSTGPAAEAELDLDPQERGLSADFAADDGTQVVTASASVAACREPGPDGCVPDSPLDRADHDADPLTSTSADADLALPPGAVIRWARYYWAADPTAGIAGDAAPEPGQVDQANLTVPSGEYYRFTADRVDVDHGAYQASADVTDYVVEGGTFTGADVQMGTGRNRWGSWTLVVAYEGLVPTTVGPPTVVLSGLTRVAPDTTTTVRPGGPQLLAAAPWATDLVAYEGDTDLRDDRTTVLGRAVDDLFDSWSNDGDAATFGAGLDHDVERATTDDGGPVTVAAGHDAQYLGLLVAQPG
jgi:RNA polymerase sigma factor (sigma-70 family)